MKNKPYVTIGLIARNEEKYIIHTLKYLAQQSYGKEWFEIIIADGWSTDRTREISEDFLEHEHISHKIINERHYKNLWNGVPYGPSFGRNVIITEAASKSKYIAWIDADCRADIYRLEKLVARMEWTDNAIIAAWWPRLVETQWPISKRELMVNYYFTSAIMTMGNPAFTTRNDIQFVESLAGYNSIYKIDMIKKYMYSTRYAFNNDDIEINFRIRKDWYKLAYTPEAKIYHRQNETVGQFLKHLIAYGEWAARTTKIHKAFPRIYVPLSVCYFLYSLLLLITLPLFWPLVLLPYILVLLLSIAVFIENIKKTRSLQSLKVFVLVFAHPFMYGYGFIREMFKK